MASLEELDEVSEVEEVEDNGAGPIGAVICDAAAVRS
jgi:hypothetical protein